MSFVNVNQKLGKFTVDSIYYDKVKKRNFARVKCECGKEQIIRNDSSALKRNGCKSCTFVKEIKLGTKFGKLTILKCLGITIFDKDQSYLGYLCKCECGKKICKLQVKIKGTDLRSGRRKTCGACNKYRIFLPGNKSKLNIKKHYLSRILQGIIQRIHNPNHAAYHCYGKRGIELYAPWYNTINFINDVEKEIGPRPQTDMELDRIDPNKNYEPNNIRWVTGAQNLANRRNCKKYRDVNVIVMREQVLVLLDKLTIEQYSQVKENPLVQKLIKQLDYEYRKSDTSG